MKKISTLFKKDINDLSKVTNEINPENQWVFDGNFIATQKFDGTATAIIDGQLYKRYDAKLVLGKYKRPIPIGAIPCQEADIHTGHHPHWVLCNRELKEDKYFFEAFDKLDNPIDGTYELCGDKVQGNKERIVGHELIKHGSVVLECPTLDYDSLKEYLQHTDIEGIVFHSTTDDRMCKIRKVDFGIKR